MDNSTRLDKWNVVKKDIDKQNFKKQVEIQSIYWISIGQNVGSEVYDDDSGVYASLRGDFFASLILSILQSKNKTL